eukprot:TRINITY_DN4348_c0_g2_i1.p1 TRINITY_DN4348_c0_g2~~TRINITY_DN4348_c0_g2_i1.p1  ORF type:complete len:476 (+),score=118.58 TRINITY_DN4348_c0_g2_i1:95-1522(+)
MASCSGGRSPAALGLPRDVWLSAGHVAALQATEAVSQLAGVAAVFAAEGEEAAAGFAACMGAYSLACAWPSGMALCVERLCPQLWDGDAYSTIPPMFLRRCVGFALLFAACVNAALLYVHWYMATVPTALLVFFLAALPAMAVRECSVRYLISRQYGRRSTLPFLALVDGVSCVLYAAACLIGTARIGAAGVAGCYAVLRCVVPAGVFVGTVVATTEGPCRTVLLHGGAFINLNGVDKGSKVVLSIGVPAALMLMAQRVPFDGFLCLPAWLVPRAAIAAGGVCVAAVRLASTLPLTAAQAVTAAIGRRLAEGDSAAAADLVPAAGALARLVAAVLGGGGAAATATLYALDDVLTAQVVGAIALFLVTDASAYVGTGVLRGAQCASPPLDLSRRPGGAFLAACAVPACYAATFPGGLQNLWLALAAAQALAAGAAWYRVGRIPWADQTAHVIGEHTPLNPSKRQGRVLPTYHHDCL